MFRKFISLLLFTTLLLLPCINLYALDEIEQDNSTLPPDDKTLFTIRLGEGGFRDSRSPENTLGGGQFALDIRPRGRSFMLSLSSEYYTNSPEPTSPYEISDMYALNLLYVTSFLNNPEIDLFLGGGVGRLKVPNQPKVASSLYNLEAGIHWKPFKRFGFYGLYKYLYANKDMGNVELIDFNEHIFLLGGTYNFKIHMMWD